jgi:hypothetical protein
MGMSVPPGVVAAILRHGRKIAQTLRGASAAVADAAAGGVRMPAGLRQQPRCTARRAAPTSDSGMPASTAATIAATAASAAPLGVAGVSRAWVSPTALHPGIDPHELLAPARWNRRNLRGYGDFRTSQRLGWPKREERRR